MGVVVARVRSCMSVGWWYWFPVLVEYKGIGYVVWVGVTGVWGEDDVVRVFSSIVGVWGSSGYNVGPAAFVIVVVAWEVLAGAGVVVRHVS